MTNATDNLIPVNGVDEIPKNLSTEEYAEFWETHTPSREMIGAAQSDPETWALLNKIAPRIRPRQPRQPKATHVTTLRLDEDMERRLKHLAALKKVPYQTLLKQFVGERLYEEEKREGIVD